MNFSDFSFTYSVKERISKLRDTTALSLKESAELKSLEEFPDNPTASTYAEKEIFASKENCSSPLTPEQRESLRSVRLSLRQQGSNSESLFCDKVKIQKYQQMLSQDSGTFLKKLEGILETHTSYNSLLHDEFLKDMLYQRYSVLGVNGGWILNLASFTKDQAMEKFYQREEKRNEALARQNRIPRENELSNNGIARGITYPQYWANNPNINVTDSTRYNVAHGGGYRFLKQFLAGDHIGYKLEHQEARGIQVHPFSKDPSRLRSYANNSKANFDTPAVITFDIEAQYLDSQPNAYEAGIRAELLQHGENFILENCVTGETIKGANLEEIRTSIQKKLSGIGNL